MVSGEVISVVLGGGCLVWEGGRWVLQVGCGGVGVVKGYCCFLAVECFLKVRGEFEFVVEFVDRDEGSKALACFLGRGLEFFRSEASFDVE